MDGRLEVPHLAFPLSRRLVRDFGAVVRILNDAVDRRRHHAAARRRVAAQLVGDQSARDITLAFEKLPKEPHRGATISARLHEDIEHVAILIHRSPEVLPAAVERHEEFVEMPRVTLLPAPVPQRASVDRAERQAPLTDRLVGDGDAPLGQQAFDVPEAERESVIQPHRVADDLRRESVAAVARCLAAQPPTVPPYTLNLTMPGELESNTQNVSADRLKKVNYLLATLGYDAVNH